MVNACDEFVTMIAKESRKVGRYAANEHEQRLRLQDQLEELAQQHSSLERAAYRTARESDLTSEPR
uniref:Transposase n=1 Tax=Ascaris lumbricoides TaxID=6252 RepID=A0A0M3ISE8_ASCLU